VPPEPLAPPRANDPSELIDPPCWRFPPEEFDPPLDAVDGQGPAGPFRLHPLQGQRLESQIGHRSLERRTV
jgi:hypothetical protein